MSTGRRRARGSETFEPVAGNGLLDRRLLLRSGLTLAGAAAGMTAAGAEPLEDAPWSRMQGSTSAANEKPSRYEDGVKRILSNPKGEPRCGASCATDCQATDSASVIACSANTLSTAVIRSW